MKYRFDNEYHDIIEVAFTYKVDVTKHSVPEYDMDAVLEHLEITLPETADGKQYTVSDYWQTMDNTDLYRVVQIRFSNSGGEFTMFSSHRSIPEGKMIVDKPVEEPKAEDKADGKPIDLSERPYF